MDIYTAFLFGVLVGHWVLLFAIWRGVIKVIGLLDALERNTVPDNDPKPVRLLEDGRRNKDDRWGPW